MVLVHSGVSDRRGWEAVAEQLNRSGCPVVAYDMRGFGSSPSIDAEFSHTDDLIAVLEWLDLEPAWIVGSSLGGGVALDAALIAPDRMRGLVLLAPAISGAPRAERLDDKTAPLAQLLEAADAAHDLDEVNRLEMRIWLDGPASPEGRVSGEARELALAMNAAALRSAAREGAGVSGLNTWGRTR